MSSDRRRASKRWLRLAGAVILLTLFLNLTYPVEELNRRLSDLEFRLQRARPTSAHVVLVVIDDASLRRIGRWPWRRSVLARLVRQSSANHPAAIGLDIVLSEPGPPREDQELAQALREAGNVVLASRLSSSPQDGLWIDPLRELVQATAGIGHVQALTGPDGICRSLPVQELTASGPRWALALEVFRVATKAQVQATSHGVLADKTFLWTEGRPESTSTPAGEKFVPALALVDFRKQLTPDQVPPSFQTVSAVDLLESGPVPDLRGKVLLVGLTAIDASDRVLTPVSDRLPMPGVELHANFLDALMEGRSLRQVSRMIQFFLLVIVSLISTWLALRWPGLTGLAMSLGLLVAIFGLSFAAFTHRRIMVDLAPLLCAGVVALPLVQVESLIVVNRGLTKGLRQLRQTLRAAAASQKLSPPTGSAQVAWAERDLSWRVDVLNRLQEELVSLYKFRENLLQAMEEGLAVYTEEGTLLFHNPRWEVFCHQQQWDPELDLNDLSLRLGKPDWSSLCNRLRHSGARLETEIQSSQSLWQLRAFRSETGGPVSANWMLTAADITSRMERDRARAEALGFVTHELRTPLTSIQGFAEFLMRYPRADKAPEAAATIFRESRRLVSLINTYLDMLRMDAGHRPLRRDQVNIREMVSQIQRIMEPLSEAAESWVSVAIAPDLPRLEGDSDLIAGTLLNLLNNAVKYSPRGSEIRLKVTGSEEDVVFEVSNPGPPIPPEDLKLLFGAFYRGREETGTARGWGLGLAFVKRIAESHGGRVEVSSDSAATVFRVILPAGSR